MSNQEIFGLHRITKKHLRELCKKHQLYETPHLNDQLYLHFQGFQSIENLEEYVGLKCLWLESNAISEIQGLECQTELKCLFLQSNLIKKIENLHCCKSLDTLNLASNRITKIENCGIEVLPELSSLNLSRNYIRKSEGLRELLNCKNLSSLDLSHNRIEDILVIKIFAGMPELKILVLQGNPVVSQVPQYRKTMILECKNLTYLDSRPVFPRDRACAEAWKRGGYEEERKEHNRWNRIDRKKIRDSVNATIRLRQHHGDGDAQLLESTDDEEDNIHRKKLRKIPEEASLVDLEITGVVHKPSQCLVEPSDHSSSTSPNESSSNSSSGSVDENEDTECAESPSKLGREQIEKQCTPSGAQQLEHVETFENEKISAVETLKQNLSLSAAEYQSKEESNLENKQEREFKSIADITQLKEFSNTTSELKYEPKEEPMNQEGLIRDQFITEDIPKEEKGQFEEYRKHEFGSLEGEDEKEAKIMSECELGSRKLPNNNENKTTVQTEEDPARQNEIKELFEESIQISEDFVLSSELNSSLVNSTLAWSAQKLAQEESIICPPYSSSRFSSTTNLSDCNLALIGEISEQNASEDSNYQYIQIIPPKEGEENMCSLKENDRKQDEEYPETDFDRLKKSSILEAFASDTSYDSNEYGFESKFADSNEELEEIFKDISELFSPRKVYKEDIKGHHQRDSPINNIMGPDSYKKNIGLENFIEYSDEEISDMSRRHSPVRIVDDYDDDECDKYIKELDYSNSRTTKLVDETVPKHFETDLKEEPNEIFKDPNFSISSHDEKILSNNALSTSSEVLQKNKYTSSKISDQQDTSPETHEAMSLEITDMPRSEITFISTHKETNLTVSSCEDQVKAMEIFDKNRSPNCPLQPEQNNNILSDNKLSEKEDFNSEDTIASSWLENFLAGTIEEAISSTKNVVESLEIDNNLNEVRSTIAFQYDSSEDIIASKWLENYLAGDIASKEDETSLKNFTIQGDKETEARVCNELNSAEEESDSSNDSNENSNSCQQVKEIDDIYQSLEAIIEEKKCHEAATELDIAESSKQASLKVDQKSMKEEVTELENCDGQKHANEFVNEQSLEDTAEGSYASEKDNSAESLYESLEEEIKDEPINQQVGEKDNEELRLGTKSETQSLKKESEKENLHQTQTSDNSISNSETTCEEISSALGKKSELSKDKVEDVNTETQDVNFESLSWWEKTLLAIRSNTLIETQSNYNHTEDSEDKEENDFENQAKESTSTFQENILETIRDSKIEKREQQSLSSSKAAKQNPEENDDISADYQYSKSQDAYSMIVRKMFEASQIRKKKLESEAILKFQEDGSSSDSSESESESSNSSSSESFQQDHTDCSTLREVVKTFNQVTEKMSQQKQDKSELIKELIANPLTQTFSAQTSDQINHQVEELKQEQRGRLSQLVDCVYAQRDKYDDTLEVVNGRLMVVKRSTGALEELPPPPPSRPSGSTKYISCGVSATQTSCNYDDSDFDDNGTVLSEDNEDDEDEDENDIEQHASDTKIKKILYSSPLSDVNSANESVPLLSSGSSTSIEREEDKNDHYLDSDSQQGAARKLYNEIDANAETEVLPEFSEWLQKDAGETAADYMLTLKKKKGKEEILLMQKFSEVVGGGEQRNELQVELDNSTQSFTDFGEAAVLEDIALIFESPERVEL